MVGGFPLHSTQRMVHWRIPLHAYLCRMGASCDASNHAQLLCAVAVSALSVPLCWPDVILKSAVCGGEEADGRIGNESKIYVTNHISIVLR